MKHILLLTTIVLTSTLAAQPQDWNQWRGVRRDGTVTGFKPPSTWPDRPQQVWKVEAGIGHSSPVVSGNRVFLFSRVGEQEAMTAYDASSGKQIWRQAYDAPYEMSPAARGHGKGPKSTPVVDRGRVFALGISGILSAFDATTGRVLWRQEFTKDFKRTSPEFGASMSPLVDGDTVIAHVGGDRDGAIVAFATAEGSRKWTWKGDGPAYTSPVIATFAGTRHLITQTQAHMVGLSPSDGREWWRIPFTTDYDQNIVTPLVIEGILVYSGLSKPLVAMRLATESGSWKPQPAWQNPDAPMYMSSPVAAGGVIYGLTHRNRGQFFAVDAQTGQTLWTSPPRQGENAALTISGELVIATTTEGKLVVMRRGTKSFDPIREYTLADGPIWAHPAFHGRGILVKDASTLSYWTF